MLNTASHAEDEAKARTLLVEVLRASEWPAADVAWTDTRSFELNLVERVAGREYEWAPMERGLEGVFGGDGDAPEMAQQCGFTGEDFRFAALYALCMRARLDNRLGYYESCLKKAEDEPWAKDRGGFHHLWSMYLSARQDQGQNDLQQALKRAEQALKKAKNHVGFMHNLAEVTAKLAEGEFIERGGKEVCSALDLARKITASKDEGGEPGYPKFWATRGRLEMLCGSLKEAETSVLTALRFEHGRWDSHVRRADYGAILTQLRIEKEARALRHQLGDVSGAEERLRAYAEDTKIRHAETLGFFAAVLALILTGIQPARDGATTGGAGWSVGATSQAGSAGTAAVLLLLGGVLLVAFGALGWLLRGETAASVWRSISVALLGASLLILALVFSTVASKVEMFTLLTLAVIVFALAAGSAWGSVRTAKSRVTSSPRSAGAQPSVEGRR